nr:alpha/beta hydrolase-fold protein [Psychromicrobium silvestre]
MGLLWLLIGPPKHLKWAVPIALIGSALVILGAKFYTENILNLWGEPLRWRVYIFAALALAALALIAPRLIRSKHWYTRLLTPIAAVLVVLAAGLQINQVFGYYPTVGSLWGDNGVHVQGLLPSDTVDKSKLTPTTPTVREQSWHPPAGMPSAGKFVSVRIPATVSKVHSGVSYVYIPPAYRVQNPANVPVLVLIHGNPGGALDWQRGGRITQQMNTYAAEHHGIAPLVVMPDVTSGNSGTWSLCMDSKRAKGATFLGVDVPNYVKKTFGLGLAGGEQFAIGGFSYGGTCAMQLAVSFPKVYPTFFDFSGERGPYLNGGDSAIISKYFDGDAAAFAKANPLEVLKTTKFPHTTGVVLVGSTDFYRPQGEEVYRALKNAGAKVTLQVATGDHSWEVWRPAFADNLGWLMKRYGVTV